MTAVRAVKFPRVLSRSPAVLLGSHDVQIFLQGSRYVFDSAMQGKQRLESNRCLLLRLVYIVSSDCPFERRKPLFSVLCARRRSFHPVRQLFQRSFQFFVKGSLCDAYAFG